MRRSLISLLTALTFCVLAVTGVLAFVRPFSIQIVGLHSLLGFVFIVLVGVHVANNAPKLKEYLRSKVLWISLAMTVALTSVIFWQPGPVKSLLGLSANLGPALDRFEMSEDGIVYHYSPAADYRMLLTIKTGKAYDVENPPHFAIWLENQGAYHIKTLHGPDSIHANMLPYWAFKVRGWKKAKQEAEAGVDAISSATPNGSFDPTDYILPADPDNPMPYKLLIEINQPGDAHETSDDQPSLVYAVEIDNLYPKSFQLLELVGYPKRDDSEGEEKWALYYVDETFGSALNLIDSSLLTIDRIDP